MILLGAVMAGLAWRARPEAGGAFGQVPWLGVLLLIGAVVFSAMHYVGAYGDPFTVPSFTFRFLAGLFFSALFVLRGFGITAWAHALYDVMVLTV